MNHPCKFKVRVHTRGETKRPMIAVFAEYVDAVNFAHAESKGRHQGNTVIAYKSDGRVGHKFRNGDLA